MSIRKATFVRMDMQKLSLVVITFNEERNIRRCLESVAGLADEIVIVDSGSTDSTLQIAEEFSARIVQQKWLGYSEQKNSGNQLALHDWILSLDADEALSPDLKAEIIQIKNSGFKGVYEFPRLTNYCGTFVRHGGWYPDYKVRIFNRKNVCWQGTIHETLKGFSTTDITRLKGDCLHFSYYTIQEHIRQTEKFTDLSAQDLFAKNKNVSWIKTVFSPMARFVSGYFFKLGFLDGKAGFYIAKISAMSTRLKYKKLKSLYSK